MLSVLAAICVALALVCLFLGFAWKREQAAAMCWRTYGELELTPGPECR